MRDSFALPDQTSTKNSELYVDRWRAFAAPLLRALPGATLFAYDPGIVLMWNGKSRSFDRDVVVALNAVFRRAALERDSEDI